jgi:hypothetical protein
MSKKELLLVFCIAILVIAGPVYVLLVRDKKTPLPTQTAEPHTQTTQNANDLPLPVSFDKNKYSRDDAASIWVVANKQRPLNPKTYAPTDLVAVGGSQQLRQEAANALAQLIAAAKTEGLTISPLSGYRSYNTQVSVYNNEVNLSRIAKAPVQDTVNTKLVWLLMSVVVAVESKTVLAILPRESGWLQMLISTVLSSVTCLAKNQLLATAQNHGTSATLAPNFQLKCKNRESKLSKSSLVSLLPQITCN